MYGIIDRIKNGLKVVLICAAIPLVLSACWEDLEEISGKAVSKVYKAGEKITYFADDVSFVMVYVPGGKTFPTAINDLGTPATVGKGYWIGETEVTYELWYKVRTWARANGYTLDANPGIEGSHGAMTAPAGEPPTAAKYEPVTIINWREAMVWCNALTEWYNANNGTTSDLDCVYYIDSGYVTPIRSADDTGSFDGTAGSQDNPYVKASAKGFRLLSSNEWEYAARWRSDATNTVSGYMDPYFTRGNSASGATTNCSDTTGDPNYAGKLANDAVAVYGSYWNGLSWSSTGVTSTAVVKSKGVSGANALGLYDMSGNVSEWCFDLGSETSRVERGGSWSAPAGGLQVGTRSLRNPYLVQFNIGFRFARTQ